MQVFRELFIRGEPEQLKATAEAISSSLSGDWSRNTEDEERLRSAPLGSTKKVYCFQCKKRSRRPSATVFLMDRDAETIVDPENWTAG
jgi:hypothetical protein